MEMKNEENFYDEEGFLRDDIDLENLIELERLDVFLSEFSANQGIDPILTKESTIYEMAEATGAFARFDTAKERAKNFVHPKESLQLFLDKIQKVINSGKFQKDMRPNIISFVYQEILYGFGTNPLSDYASWLVNIEEVVKWDKGKEEPISKYDYIFKESNLKKIADGVVLAYRFSDLKKEVAELKGELPVEDDYEIPPTNAAEKFTMLEMLGILDFIDDTFENVPNEKIAKILQFLTNTPKHHTFKNYLSQKRSPKGDNYPFKEKNIETCKKYLRSISLSPIKKIKQDFM